MGCHLHKLDVIFVPPFLPDKILIKILATLRDELTLEEATDL